MIFLFTSEQTKEQTGNPHLIATVFTISAHSGLSGRDLYISFARLSPVVFPAYLPPAEFQQWNIAYLEPSNQ